MDKKTIGVLPQCPGVYFFKIKEKTIYIGKAKNLKNRVSSYFNLKLAPKTAQMVSQATNLSFIKVTSELEALLLEAKLINKYQPKYNSVLKDDKNPLYIAITKEEFPRVVTNRQRSTVDSVRWGPFPDSKTVKYVLKMLRRVFPYSDHKVGKRKCLYAHMGLCEPCPNEILQITNDKLQISNKRQYLRNISNLKSILNGKVGKVKNDLEKQMQKLSLEEKFEEAAQVREKIKRLEYITQPIIPTEAYIENPNLIEDIKNLEIKNLLSLLNKNLKLKIKNLSRIECFDVAHLSGSIPTASMVTFIDGVFDKQEYRHFKIRQIKGNSDYDSMREIASRRLKQSWDKPDLIIVDGGLGQVHSFSKIIKNIPIVGIAKNPDRLIIGKEKIKITGPALNLIQKIRDEAHRFARRLHHKNIRKNLLQ